MGHDFIYDSQRLSITKMLLKEVGEGMILSLPLPGVLGLLDSKVTQLEDCIAFITSRVGKLTSQLEVVDSQIADISGIKAKDLSYFKLINGTLASIEGKYGAVGYEAMNLIMQYNPLATKRKTLELELANTANTLVIHEAKLRDMQLVKSSIAKIGTLVVELQEAIVCLNRQGVPSSCIIDLDVAELRLLLENGGR